MNVEGIKEAGYEKLDRQWVIDQWLTWPVDIILLSWPKYWHKVFFAASKTGDLQHYRVKRSQPGSSEYLKYNSEDFCLNSQSTPCLTTEMNNWKIPRIQQNSSDIWREKGHIVESYEKQTNLIKKLFCSLGEREEITQRSTLPPYLILEAVKNSQIL